MRDNAVGMFSGTAGIGSSCFYLKQERLPWDSRRLVTSGNFPRRYYPDRVLGYFSAPLSEHPCFNNLIETLPRALCKSGGGSVQRGAPGLDFETWWWHAFRRLTATTPQPVDDNSLQRRHREAGDLCRIVGAAQPDSFAGMRPCEVLLGFGHSHRAALQRQALH